MVTVTQSRNTHARSGTFDLLRTFNTFSYRKTGAFESSCKTVSFYLLSACVHFKRQRPSYTTLITLYNTLPTKPSSLFTYFWGLGWETKWVFFSYQLKLKVRSYLPGCEVTVYEIQGFEVPHTRSDLRSHVQEAVETEIR